MPRFVDTHAHIDGPEFGQDIDEVMARARAAGAAAIFVPAIDLESSQRIVALCRRHGGFLYAMAGLHPEEVKDGWEGQLSAIRDIVATERLIAIGEVGLDFYWSRDFEREQLQAFERQVQWSAETGLPLMIHCRKAQNEMVAIMRRYERSLPGGVFHCFTGNEREAEELLRFERFVLGVGGVLTFRKSHLPETLAHVVPTDRVVLETDSPYMAPVPMRGQRNEPAYVAHVLTRMAQAYGMDEEQLAAQTCSNVERVFGIKL